MAGGREVKASPGSSVGSDSDTVPLPSLKKAKSPSKSSDPAAGTTDLLGANNDGGSRGMMLAGSHPAAVVLNGMATIEQQIKLMSRFVPQILQIAAPFIDDMKAATAAGLADLVSGGTGSANIGSGPSAGVGGAVPTGGPASGMPPMGPPPPPQAAMPMQ